MSFNPRPPRGGRQAIHVGGKGRKRFQSTPPAWGATQASYAPRARTWRFNPRPPRGGRRKSSHSPFNISAFQSTPPAWGATCAYGFRTHHQARFNPRPPRGGRPARQLSQRLRDRFNPRPPRGGRHSYFGSTLNAPMFQSTPPAWGATFLGVFNWIVNDVSIHAPRVGGDAVWVPQRSIDAVSIHAPRVGGDDISTAPLRRDLCFNPRPPRGGRHCPRKYRLIRQWFQSTPPAWGATRAIFSRTSCGSSFNPRPPRGGRRRIA